MVPKGAWLDSGLKKDVHHTGGHLGRRGGGQCDLHFYNLDVRRNIVKWGVIFGVLHGAWLKSEFKMYIILEVTNIPKVEVNDLHFDILLQWGQYDLHFSFKSDIL